MADMLHRYSVMKGYWGDEKKTKESIDGMGWMHTGDLAGMFDRYLTDTLTNSHH